MIIHAIVKLIIIIIIIIIIIMIILIRRKRTKIKQINIFLLICFVIEITAKTIMTIVINNIKMINSTK